MAIWNCTDDDNDVARLLALALPNINTEAEMAKLDPKDLDGVITYANSMTDCLLAQQAALADLIANADTNNLDKHTIRNAGWLLRELTHLHELNRRAADLAVAYSGKDCEFHKALALGDTAAAVARITQ